MAQLKKKSPTNYEGIEHLFAKEKYAERLRADWLRVDVEKRLFCWVGNFIPDIAVYDENGIAGIYEIVFTHDVDLRKMNKIWTYSNDISRALFLRTITAENVINDNYVFMMDVIL